MLHKISDMCKKVAVMQKLSNELYHMKYKTAKESRDETQIQMHIDSIKALAGDIYNDRSPYVKDDVNGWHPTLSSI